MPPAGPSLIDQASGLARVGRFSEAYRLLAGAADGNDPDALFTLGMWRLAGDVVARDLIASREYFGRAMGAGHPEAEHIYTAFVGNGTGGPPDWCAAVQLLEHSATRDPDARRQLDIIGQMGLTPTGDPTTLPPEQALSTAPQVSCFRALFSRAECDFLVARATPLLQPSVVVDPQTGRFVQNPVRTSDAMAFPWVAESPAIHALNRRMAAATKTDVAQGEPLQVLRYRGGQEYKPHSDAVAGDPNQRIVTALVYLNDDYAGGETLFVKTGLRFKGAAGDALVFRNALGDGRADPAAQHAGLPVTTGEKLIASRWIRARRFILPPPRPMLDA